MAEENNNNQAVEENISPAVNEEMQQQIAEGAQEELERQLGPSLPENQVETQQALEAEQQLQDKKDAIIRQADAAVRNQSPMGFAIEPTGQQILDEARNQAESRAVMEDNLRFDEREKRKKIAARIEARKADLAEAAQLGIDLEPDPELDPLIQKQAEEEAMIANAADQQAEKLAAKVEQAATPTEADIEIAQAPLRQQRATQIAIEKQQAQKEADEVAISEKFDQLNRDLNKKIEEIKADPINPNRYWESKTSGQKILAAIAAGIAGYGAGLSGQKTNVVLDTINKEIERDIELQKEKRKLNLEQIEALREQGYKMVQLMLDEQAQKTSNMKTRADIRNINSMIAQRTAETKEKKDALVRQQAILDHYNKTGDIPSHLIDKEMFERAAPLRKEYAAATKDLRTKDSIVAYNTLQEMAKDETAQSDIGFVFTFMKSFDPTSVVRESEFKTASEARAWFEKLDEDSKLRVPTVVKQSILKAKTGRFLTDVQRKGMIQTARRAALGRLKQQKEINKRFTKLARDTFVPSKLVGIEQFDINKIDQSTATGTPQAKNKANIQSIMNKYSLSEEKAQQLLEKTGNWFN